MQETYTEQGLSCEWKQMAGGAINAVMRVLRVPTALLGYRYIFYAAYLFVTGDPRERQSIQRTLYTRIGTAMDTTRPMIARSMQYAIAQAWRTADPEVLRAYTGGRQVSPKDPPGNLEFVSMIAERVRLIVGDPYGEACRTEVHARLKTRFPWLNGLTNPTLVW